MHESEIATAADYADAMLTARRAKHVLVLLLILVIMGQLAIFFAIRYELLHVPEAQVAIVTPPPTTDPAADAPAAARRRSPMLRSRLSRPVPLAVAALTLALVGPARAQYGYIYPGGYGGWGGWGATTAFGDAARGMGVFAAGVGQYNVQTAQARAASSQKAPSSRPPSPDDGSSSPGSSPGTSGRATTSVLTRTRTNRPRALWAGVETSAAEGVETDIRHCSSTP